MPISIATQEDCMQMMKRYEDKFFDLAIVDPPYGIEWDGENDILKKGRPDKFDRQNNPKYLKKHWDSAIPTKQYFDELFRVSVNQIIWGGNYFTDFLEPKRCWIFWDKLYENTFNFSHGELAWTSFEKRTLKVVMSSKIDSRGGLNKIHPIQKPIKLYKWIFGEFAKPGDKILDTHLGSQSSRIAAYKLGFDFWGTELDPVYFKEGCERFEKAISMPLFDEVKKPEQIKLL